jgi:hypothetical protein
MAEDELMTVRAAAPAPGFPPTLRRPRRRQAMESRIEVRVCGSDRPRGRPFRVERCTEGARSVSFEVHT